MVKVTQKKISYSWSLDGASSRPKKKWGVHLLTGRKGCTLSYHVTVCGLSTLRSRAKIAGHHVCKKCTAFAVRNGIELPK